METAPLHPAVFVWFVITLLIASHFFVYSLGRNRPKRINLINWSHLPFPGAIMEEYQGIGATKIEKRLFGLYVDGRRVVLHHSPGQLSKMSPNGHQLRNELRGKPVLNANLLYFLMEHPQFIPRDWKPKTDWAPSLRIYFWGTTYTNFGGGTYVRYLSWHVDFYGGKWTESHYALKRLWQFADLAATLESHHQES